MARSITPKATPLPLHKADVGLYFVVTIAVAMVLGFASVFINLHCTYVNGQPKDCSSTLPFYQLLLGSVIVEASGLIAVALKRRQGVAWFGFVKTPMKPSAKLIIMGVGVIAAIELATAMLGNYVSFFRQAEYGLTGKAPTVPMLEFALFAVLIAPSLEEFLFRGIFFRAIWTKTGPIAAAIISSLIFTLAHGISGATLGIFVIGLLLCYMYKRSGSIIPGIILHTANNLFAVILLALGVG